MGISKIPQKVLPIAHKQISDLSHHSGGFSGNFDYRQKPLNVFISVARKKQKGLSKLDMPAKRAAVLEIANRINRATEGHDKIASTPTLSAPKDTDGNLIVEHESILIFPYLHTDMNSLNDEASCNVELWHTQIDTLLQETAVNEYAAALPWPVAVYTDGDTIKVSIRSAAASVRMFMHDEKSRDRRRYEQIAAEIDADIIAYLKETLETIDGFEFDHPDDMDATSITTSDVRRIIVNGAHYDGDGMLDYGTPSISFKSDATVEEMVQTMLHAVNACRTPILSPESTGGCTPEDFQMLPMMFGNYVNGKDTEGLSAALGQAQIVWENGGTFQKWKSVKLYAPKSAKGDLHVISICQPFYATTMLNLTGAFHQTTMPCRIMIWKEEETFHISMSNPEVFLPAFFHDAVLPDNLAKLFPVFATFVHNEIAAMINHTLISYCDVPAERLFELYELGEL